MPRYFTIGETADYFGVSVDTIRRWESEGRITSERTKGGHRRFLASTLAGIEEEELVQDVLEIIQVFAARLYGKRSHRNQKLIEDLHSATLSNLDKVADKGVESPK